MLGLRVILGMLEAGLYPSIVYLLATWYSRCTCMHEFDDVQFDQAG